MVLLQDVSFILFLMDEMVNHYNDGGGHIESSKSYDEVTSFDSITDAQIDMICHPDEVVNFDSMGDAQIDMICHPDIVASFDSMDDTQIDMIYHPDDEAIFYSIPVNQNDSFLSLFLLFFQNYYFLTFDFEIRGCVMFQILLKCFINVLKISYQNCLRG